MNRNQRVASIVILIPLVGLGFFFLMTSRRSDESRIRKTLARMERGFNESRARSCVEPLAKEYREETTGWDRPTLRALLRYLFIRESSVETGKFRFKVEVAGDSIDVLIDPHSPSRAQVVATAVFFELQRETWEKVWEIDIDAELEKEKRAWKISSSSHKTVTGRDPF